MTKWIKLLGLVLDIIGTIIIGVAVVNFHLHLKEINNLRRVEEKINQRLERESTMTMVGISLVVTGFVLIFGEEMYDSYIKKK
jgi:uncharacterized membrane protein YidH (DUF202 family)